MNIVVLQTDIDNGRACNCQHCPVARAINRVLKGGYFAESGCLNIVILQEGCTVPECTLSTPSLVNQFINAYDQLLRAKSGPPASCHANGLPGLAR